MTLISKPGTAQIEKIKKVGKTVVSEEHKEELIAGELLTVEPSASVHFEVKRVVNMLNFESVHITIGVTLPCSEKNINKTYLKAKDFVETRLEPEIEELEKARQESSADLLDASDYLLGTDDSEEYDGDI